MAKFSFEVMQECVYPFTVKESEDPDVILGSAFGEDVAVTRVGDDLLLSHVDPIVGAVNGIGWLAVHVACNDIAASGIKPRWIQLLVMLPSQEDTNDLKQIMCDAARAARSLNVTIIGGHTEASNGLKRPLVAATALAPACGKRVVRTSGAKPGDIIYVTRGVGLEGTGILASDFAVEARKRGLTDQDLNEALKLLSSVSVVSDALKLADLGATAMHDVTRGGILETLLEIASCSGVCMEVDPSRIPVPKVVKRFANAFEFDPLKMISSGTLVATLPPEMCETAEALFENQPCKLFRIGVVTEGRGVLLRSGSESHLYTQIACEQDELTRMWALLRPEGN